MKTINEYEIPLMNRAPVLQLPSNFECIGIGTNGDKIVMWAMVDANDDTCDVTFLLYLNGQELEEGREVDLYLGTAILTDGTTFHVFERVS
jgi:hypothetical protein